MGLLKNGNHSSNSRPAEQETTYIYALAGKLGNEYKAIILKHCTTLTWIQVFDRQHGAADCRSDIRNAERSRKQRINVRQQSRSVAAFRNNSRGRSILANRV